MQSTEQISKYREDMFTKHTAHSTLSSDKKTNKIIDPVGSVYPTFWIEPLVPATLLATIYWVKTLTMLLGREHSMM